MTRATIIVNIYNGPYFDNQKNEFFILRQIKGATN